MLTLLQYGIKNAIAVEGTDVPDSVAELTNERTITTFLDGDRGGELIRKELAQVGDIDYVALAPEGCSVEDLARHEVMTALREKIPYDQLLEDGPKSRSEDEIDQSPTGSTTESVELVRTPDAVDGGTTDAAMDAANTTEESLKRPKQGETTPKTEAEKRSEAGTNSDKKGTANDEAEADTDADKAAAEKSDTGEQLTLREHTVAVIGEETGMVRLLDGEFGVLEEGEASAAFDLLTETDPVPTAVVIDGELSQHLLDVAAQRGIDHIVAASIGEFVKQPTSVRVRTVEQLLTPSEA